jgi:Flp pilus assembly protein TadG
MSEESIVRTRVTRAWTTRRGAAAAELAVLLPFLIFLFVVGVDFARVFYFSVILTNSARNGAVYGSGSPTQAADTAGIQQAALADATDLSPAPTVASTTGTDASNYQYVKVTVQQPFHTVISFPGVPSAFTLTRTVQMRVSSLTPKPGTF